MASKLVFESSKTGKKFEVLNWDRETNELTLKGPTSTFNEVFDKDLFKKLGYTLKRVEVPADEPEETEDA